MSRHTAGAAPVRQKRLIVNADDFGSSEAVNEAVVRAYTEGVLTSCSLMVTGKRSSTPCVWHTPILVWR